MTMMTLTVILTVINLLMILMLVYTYLQNYRNMRAQFSLGLLLFAVLFAIQKLVALYVYLIIMHKFSNDIGGALFSLEIIQFFAFSILSWITMK